MQPGSETIGAEEGAQDSGRVQIDSERVERAISRVVSALSPDLLSPRYQAEFAAYCHPTTGHCAVAAEAVYFLLGGRGAGLVPMVAREEDGSSHWWLVHRPSGRVIDPTREQYDDVGDVPPYERGNLGRACGFQGMRRDPENRFGFGLMPGSRAAELLRRVETNDRDVSPVCRSGSMSII